MFGAYEHNERDSLAGADRDFASERSSRARRLGCTLDARLSRQHHLRHDALSAAARQRRRPHARRQLVAGAPNRFDDTAFADLLPKQERDTFFLDARQEFGRWDAWYQGWYSDRDFEESVAPASGQLRVPNTNPYFVAPAALGTPAFVNVEYRFLERGCRSAARPATRRRSRTRWVSASMLGGDWRIEGYANLSKNHGFQRRGAITNGAALTAALASSNPATAFNPFGDGTLQRHEQSGAGRPDHRQSRHVRHERGT